MAPEEESMDPADDPDFISEEGSGGQLQVPYSSLSAGWIGRPDPVFVPKQSTPLEDESEHGDGPIPRFALWSMRYLGHSHFLNRPEIEIRQRFGEGVNAVYVMDDGRKYCLVCRQVGSGPDGCTYALVAQVTISSYENLVDGAPVLSVFSAARSWSLCAVYEAVDAVSNVAVVETYRTVDEVPVEYLPPHPPVEFE
ncbi:MAG TPA: hypothetical protein VG298_07335 [Acidimicrobiales bacterium]|jgi:hypothetical protein|nr:hypothetical protein [Acidimicrobiales bacterium]